ncbi:unnamed protein product, partial [Dicrocoelium dendriticum]
MKYSAVALAPKYQTHTHTHSFYPDKRPCILSSAYHRLTCIHITPLKVNTVDVAMFPLCVHIIANLPSVDYQDKASFYVHMLRSSSLTVSAYQSTCVTPSTCVFCLIWDCTTLRSVGHHVLSIFAGDFLFFPA